MLKELTLRSIATPNLNYLAPLLKLWSLAIKLCGIRSFEGVEGKKSIKYLEVWQVRGFARGWNRLVPAGFTESIPAAFTSHNISLPALANANSLRRLVLQNLKGMADLATLEKAPALEDFTS